MPTINVEAKLAGAAREGPRAELERQILPGYLRNCRWFGAKARHIREMRMVEQIPMADGAAQFWLLRVDYTDGAPDIYSLPVQVGDGRGGGCNRPQFSPGGHRAHRSATGGSL